MPQRCSCPVWKGFGISAERLDEPGKSLYNNSVLNFKGKSDNGDSRDLTNVTASREGWKPGISSRLSKITPELQSLKYIQSKG